MSAAAAKKMDDSGPQNWVVPEVMKPEEKELVEKLTQVMSKNTFHRAKEATRLAWTACRVLKEFSRDLRPTFKSQRRATYRHPPSNLQLCVVLS